MSFRPIYKLRDSIKNFDKHLYLRHVSYISANPLAINFIEKKRNYFIWTIFLYGNPNAVHLIEDHFKKLDPVTLNELDLTFWDELSGNPNALHIMKKHIDKINWVEISKYTGDIDFLEEHIDKLNWEWISRNQNAIPFIEKHLDKIEWQYLCQNENAVHILEQNQD